MKKIKNVMSMIGYNIWTLVGFEILFKVLSLLIFTPLFLNLFNGIMKITGYTYLTIENVFSFLTNPLTFFMLLILILLMTIYTMFDVTTIIIILDASYQKKKITVMDAIHLSLQKCKKGFRLQHIPLAFLLLFLIPFLNIGVSSSFITTIKIPEFIFEFIEQNPILLGLFLFLVGILFIIFFRWFYSIHYFVLEDLSFKEARKKSIALGKGKHIRDFFTLLIVQLTIVIIYILFIFLGIFLILGCNQWFGNITILKSFTATMIWIFIALSFIIVTVLATPISYATISVLYYLRKHQIQEEVTSISFKTITKGLHIGRQLKRGILGLSVLAILLGTIFTYGLYQGAYNLNIEHLRTLEVTAHRGASVDYPENTMRAFLGAKELGTDWIELDVQQTKDGQIIVIHDTNLKRTAGFDKYTWEVTYEEIKDLDAGSFMGKEFANEKIPLLEEVVRWAKENHIRLNIELKPTGKEINFENSVLEIIQKYDFIHDCVITSQVYEVLEKVKAIDSNIQTVYVMSLAYGNITSLTAADHFSIEATSITASLVKKVHKEGKQIYAWTVNTTENIEKMIDLNVDNIITDNISLAKERIYASKTSNLITEYIKFIEKLIK